MGENNQLTAEENWHVQVMTSIAKSVVDTPFILKGGTALLLAYGLDRFSEDLDFDSTKAIRLENRIKDAIKFPIQIKSIDILKDTDTVTRYRLVYDSPQRKENRLKIEISYRTHCPETFQLIQGIKVYDIPSLIEQKLLAIEHRTQARDLYDIHFLATHYGHAFSESQKQHVSSFLLSDLNALEERFTPAFDDDDILASHDISRIILGLHEAFGLKQSRKESDVLFDDFSESTKENIKAYLHEQYQLSALVRQKNQHLGKNPVHSKDYAEQAKRVSEEIDHIAKALLSDKAVQYILKQKEFHSLQRQGGFAEIQERLQNNTLTNTDITVILLHAQEMVCSQLQSRHQSHDQKKGGRSLK
jgi:acyl carrier protein